MKDRVYKVTDANGKFVKVMHSYVPESAKDVETLRAREQRRPFAKTGLGAEKK